MVYLTKNIQEKWEILILKNIPTKHITKPNCRGVKTEVHRIFVKCSASSPQYSNNSNSVSRRGFSKYLAEYVYRHVRGTYARVRELTCTATNASVCDTRAVGWPARSAAKNTRRNKLKGDVHYIDIDTTYLAVLSYTFILLLSSRRLKGLSFSAESI